MTHHLVVVSVVFALSAPTVRAAEAGPEGLWRTVDDKTGKPKGLVRIYQEKGEFFARVEASLDPAAVREFCDQCRDDRHNKPIVGMVIMRGMRRKGADYGGGDILDPDSGFIYRCKFWLEDQGKKLVVRGFAGFSLLGRSQTWIRQP